MAREENPYPGRDGREIKKPKPGVAPPPKELKRIPISAAKELARKYGYGKVVIIGMAESPPGEMKYWLTTYGKTKELCKHASALGKFMIDSLWELAK